MSDTLIAKIAFMFFVSYISCYFLTPLVRIFCVVLGMIDFPGERRVHKRAVPRGVGLSLIITFHLMLANTMYMGKHEVFLGSQFDVHWWFSYVMATGVLFIVGVYDDLYDMNPLFKLIGQTTSALIMYLGGIHFGSELFGIPVSPFVSFCMTMLWFLIVTNAFNLIDGYDGLATGLAIIGGLGLFGTLILKGRFHEGLVLASFIGACFGFLRYNFHPASVFLGDTGSLFIGFTMATFCISTSLTGTGFAALWVPLSAVGLPLFDTFLAVWRRGTRRVLGQLVNVKSKKGVMSADMEHVHHRLARSGMTPRNVTAILYLLSSVFVLMGLVNVTYGSNLVMVVWIIVFITVCYLFVRMTGRIELWESGMVIVLSLGRRGKSLVSATGFLVLDSIGAMLLLLIAFRCYYVTNSHISLTRQWAALSPYFLTIPPLCLALYDFVWNSSRYVHQYPGFLGRIAIAMIGCLLALFVSSPLLPGLGISFASGLAISLIVGGLLSVHANFVRMMPDRLEKLMMLNLIYSGVPIPDYYSLVCGRFSDCKKHVQLNDDPNVVSPIGGIVTTDEVGEREKEDVLFLGTLEQLQEIVMRLTIRELIVVSPLARDQLIQLLKVTRYQSIKVTVITEEM